jgi:hypothetical protein
MALEEYYYRGVDYKYSEEMSHWQIQVEVEVRSLRGE